MSYKPKREALALASASFLALGNICFVNVKRRIGKHALPAGYEKM
jgi:hypothetical protein